MYGDIVEIWFQIADGQILSIFDRVICPRHIHIFIWRHDNGGVLSFHILLSAAVVIGALRVKVLV